MFNINFSKIWIKKKFWNVFYEKGNKLDFQTESPRLRSQLVFWFLKNLGSFPLAFVYLILWLHNAFFRIVTLFQNIFAVNLKNANLIYVVMLRSRIKYKPLCMSFHYAGIIFNNLFLFNIFFTKFEKSSEFFLRPLHLF